MVCVKAPVILHQSHFPRLTGPNSPHTASLAAAAAAILIARLGAVAFSHHIACMRGTGYICMEGAQPEPFLALESRFLAFQLEKRRLFVVSVYV